MEKRQRSNARKVVTKRGVYNFHHTVVIKELFSTSGVSIDNNLVLSKIKMNDRMSLYDTYPSLIVMIALTTKTPNYFQTNRLFLSALVKMSRTFYCDIRLFSCTCVIL